VPRIESVIGPPGTGKTTRLLKDVEELLAKEIKAHVAITSYTNYSCNEVARRLESPSVKAETLYKLASPHTKKYRPGGNSFKARNKLYQNSILWSGNTAAIQQYVNDAPSSAPRREREFLQHRLRELHSCTDKFPSWIHDEKFPRGMEYDVTLARWLEDGAPRKFLHPFFSHIFVDEAQDVSVLQGRVIQALCLPGGTIRAYGDPHQAILTQGLEGEQPSLFARAGETETLTGGFRVPLNIAQLAQQVMEPLGCPPAEDWADHSRTGDILLFGQGMKPRSGFCIAHSRAVAATFANCCPVPFILDPRVCLKEKIDFCHTPLFGAPAMVKGWESKTVYLHKFAPRFMRAYDEGCPHVRRQVYVAITRCQRRLLLHSEWYRRLVG
jgi:AAA domain-containing protein